MSDAIGLMCLGSIFAVVGIVSIARKRFTMPFGRIGFFKPKPVITFVLTEGRAVLFGCASLISGLIMMGIGWNVYSTRNEEAITDGVLTVTVIIAVFITFFGFLFALFMGFLESLRKRATNKEGTDGKSGDSTDN